MAKQLVMHSTLLLFLLGTAPNGYPQERTQEKPKPGAVQKEARPVPKAADEAPSDDTGQSSETALNRAILFLSQQITELTKEVKRMRQDSDRSSTILELLLYEERLLRLEDRIEKAVNDKAQLDAREQEVVRRQRNIAQELILRGGTALRRDEAEAALRQEFQRTLEDVRTQQQAHQTKIAEMQAQADRLRYRIDILRQKAARIETRTEDK